MPAKMVEIDENQLVNLQNITGIVRDINSNPELKESFLRSVKKVRPDMPIPEIDAVDPIKAELAALKTQQAEFIAKQEAAQREREEKQQVNEFEQKWLAQQRELLDMGYMKAGVETIVAFAKENGIPNLHAAAAYYEKLNPPDIVSPHSSLFGAAAGDDGDPRAALTQKLLKSRLENGIVNDALVAAEVRSTLSDIRSNNRRF